MEIEEKIKKTIKDYALFSKKDKILVACSGGKDSTTILYILHKLGYNPEALSVDASIGDYTKQNLENLKKFCKYNKIKLHVVSFKKEFGYSLCYIKSILNSKGVHATSCTICGVLRRYLVNKYARKLKATKLVTGHNLNDEAQAVMMNLFKNNVEILARHGPITGTVKNKKFVQRVKPMYFISEEEVVAYSKKHKFPVKYGYCPCRSGVYRCMTDEVLCTYEENHPGVHKNIINWFLNVAPLLKKHFKTSKEQDFCSNCGEPSRGKVCMACQIISKLK